MGRGLWPWPTLLVLVLGEVLGQEDWPPPPRSALEEHRAQVIQELCWSGSEHLSFQLCCRFHNVDMPGVNKEEEPGFPFCWDQEQRFTYETCCLDELKEKVNSGIRLLYEGNYRAASYDLFDLVASYLRRYTPEFDLAFLAWQKATASFRKSLDDLPKTLMYHEVLFAGLGTDCMLDGADKPLPLFEAFTRCCPFSFTSKPCSLIFDMMALALDKRYRRDPGRLEAYYADMSEHWAFHHFTPSLLTDEDTLGPTGRLKWFDMSSHRAHEIDKELAAAFSASSEPSTGIMWASLIDMQSSKFEVGVFLLTTLVTVLRQHFRGPLTMDLIEIGAGYGSLPRIVAKARSRLSALSGAQQPVHVRSYTILDVRFVLNLQRWYLNSTAADAVLQRDWAQLQPDLEIAEATAAALYPEAAVPEVLQLTRAREDEKFRIDFVDTEHLDLWAHLFAEGHQNERRLGPPGKDGLPLRVLLAVNSWHEFPMADFLRFHNLLVSAPPYLAGVDAILYVSNHHWEGNAAKQALLMIPRTRWAFTVAYEECNEETCVRVLIRVD